MRYVSLDIETTCIVPKNPNRILQLAMVAEDSEVDTPLEELPFFSAIIIPSGEISGSPTALAMNAWIFVAIEMSRSKMKPEEFIKRYEELGIPRETLQRAAAALKTNFFGNLDVVVYSANEWLDRIFGERDHINVAGKNVAGFDIPFLPPTLTDRFRHRCIDPGSVFIDWKAKSVPGSGDIAKKCGSSNVSHDAYGDAIDVIRWLRTTYPSKE